MPFETNDAFTADHMSAFLRIKKRVVDAVTHLLDRGVSGKGYDGRLSLIFPGSYEDDCSIALSCYMFGPSLYYKWDGKDWTEVLQKAEADITKWIEQDAPESLRRLRLPYEWGIDRPDPDLCTRILPDVHYAEAFRQGFWAHSYAMNLDANPYPCGSPESWKWSDGWNERNNDLKEELED